jgi:N-6 DNA Methylase
MLRKTSSGLTATTRLRLSDRLRLDSQSPSPDGGATYGSRWQMRVHQQTIIRNIYEASGRAGTPLSSDYRDWVVAVKGRRGELDRKKKVSQADLIAALAGSAQPVELERFIFAVDRYLTRRALKAVELCLDVPLRAIDALPGIVRQGIAFTESVDSVLVEACPLETASDDQDLQLTILHALEAGLEDTFQDEYMGLIPRQVRHAIGSFFTPQWLARHVIRELGYRHEAPESLRQSMCDPACGSGVFLIAAAEELRQAAVAGSIEPAEVVDRILTLLHGIDVELVPCLLTTASLMIAARTVAIIGGISLDRVPNTIRCEDTLDQGDGSERFDVIVGNPPWVNWEYMPTEYRDKHSALWLRLGIFNARGKTMSFSKEDISALFVAHAVHYRLKDAGKYGFVLPESLFKSTQNHRGFRHFRLGPERIPYKVNRLEDFVQVKPFEGVANRTVVMFGEKNGKTEYPVPFVQWTGFARVAQPVTGSLGLKGDAVHGFAQIADTYDPGSSWSTGTNAAIQTHRRIDGLNAYRARTGLFTGGANAVYHLRPLSQSRSGHLLVENVVERAKRIVPQVRTELEDTYVYPFLRGRDVSQWQSTVELGVLLPHTAETKMTPVTEEVLGEVAPQTLEYFRAFRGILDDRRGFSSWERPFRDAGFYACQRVGAYTFNPWKVIWRYISPRFTTAVIGPVTFAGMPTKPVIPNEKLMLIACDSEQEAFFLGGVLAGSVVVEHIQSRMVSTQISPSIIAGIGVPLFDPDSAVHREIARICAVGHDRRRSGRGASAEDVDHLDELVAGLWMLDAPAARQARERNPF